jgi:hypothetical protein
VNDASTQPYTTARLKLWSFTRAIRARAPTKPPAKLSPAPVGSMTLSIGKAGQVKKSSCP